MQMHLIITLYWALVCLLLFWFEHRNDSPILNQVGEALTVQGVPKLLVAWVKINYVLCKTKLTSKDKESGQIEICPALPQIYQRFYWNVHM